MQYIKSTQQRLDVLNQAVNDGVTLRYADMVNECYIPYDERFSHLFTEEEKANLIDLDFWHDETCTIQIKLNHFDNANMLKKYPHMANYGGVLPCFIEMDYVYLYANFITEEDRANLDEFKADITCR